MNSLNLSTSFNVEYKILFSSNLFDPKNKSLLNGRDECSERCLVFVDTNVYKIYGNVINEYFSKNVTSYKISEVNAEDNNKNLDQYLQIFKVLNDYPVNRRNEPVIIIGGGVVTDIVAFATSCFRRGVPHIKVPTTLMGYVDASVGIKTGINFGEYKNRMGSFYPPQAVLLDKSYFKSLPLKDISNGVGEIIKLAVIKNLVLFNLLEKSCLKLMNSYFQCDEAEQILKYSITDMIEELEPNLYEDNLKRIVDFGHTFSLIFEMEGKNSIKHGEAVAMDILLSSYISLTRKMISKQEFNRIYSLIKAFNLPIYYNMFQANMLWKSLSERVHHRNGYQHVPVPNGIGSSIFLEDITYDELQDVCSKIQMIEQIDMAS